LHISTQTANNDVVLASLSPMFGHPGEAYGLVSDAYIDTVRKVGFVFLTNGASPSYTTGPSSAFYTVEKAFFDAIDQQEQWENCLINGIGNSLPEAAFSVFPNPCKSWISVKKEHFEASGLITIRNIWGQTVLIKTLTPTEELIFVGHLPSGFYLLSDGQRMISFFKQD